MEYLQDVPQLRWSNQMKPGRTAPAFGSLNLPLVISVGFCPIQARRLTRSLLREKGERSRSSS